MPHNRLVLPSGPTSASILIVGEAPGEEEERYGAGFGHQYGTPFVGKSGWELNRMLKEVGIDRDSCRVTNVTPIRPKDNAISTFFHSKPAPGFYPLLGLQASAEIVLGWGLLEWEIRKVRPRVIIALGATAMWALTGILNRDKKGKPAALPGGILKWRGSCLSYKGIPVIPTIHPAALFRQWKYRNTVKRDLARAKSAEARPPVEPARTYHIRPTYTFALETLRWLQGLCEAGPTLLSVDIETEHRRMDCIGISWSATEGICIPFMEDQSPYWDYLEEVEIRWELRTLLSHPNARVIGQNFNYDATYLFHELLYFPTCAHDTMLQHHVLQAALPNALHFQASIYCPWYVFWKEDLKEYREAQRNLTFADVEMYWRYNLEDCFYTFELNEIQQRLLRATNLLPQAEEQMSWWPMVFWTNLKGCRHNLAARDLARREVMARMLLLEVIFYTYVGDRVGTGAKTRSVWYRSNAQMKTLFYTELGQRVVMSRSTKGPSTNADALETIADREPRLRLLCDLLIEYGHLDSLLTKTLSARLSPDGRLRTAFNLAGAETYRLSSREDPFGEGSNLQNLASKM